METAAGSLVIEVLPLTVNLVFQGEVEGDVFHFLLDEHLGARGVLLFLEVLDHVREPNGQTVVAKGGWERVREGKQWNRATGNRCAPLSNHAFYIYIYIFFTLHQCFLNAASETDGNRSACFTWRTWRTTPPSSCKWCDGIQGRKPSGSCSTPAGSHKNT